MTVSSEQCDPLEALAEEFLARKRRGELPTIAEYAAKHPEMEEEIRDLFPALLLLESVGHDTQPVPRALPRGKPAFTHLGDFRILSEVGRGSMGVVYEAEQQSLDRRVALKVLPPDVLPNADRVRRFHREARAAARLHHTNIVPVFGVGADSGTHYYAMQFINGRGLDGVLSELVRLRRDGSTSPSQQATGRHEASTVVMPGVSAPQVPWSVGSLTGSSVLTSGHESTRSYWCSIARIGTQAADALEYAHSQGVIHRDIKPSNLILDTAGNVWVTDFGLARATTDEVITHPGAIIGTIPYMAPERFRGQADARSDVYALGLTLYELLTLRPAFSGNDRLALLDDVQSRAPDRPRAIDARIPRDLETIVLKASEKDPGLRYQTAGELAADLRRFIADEPILARRTSARERLSRWARHKPALAALVVVLASALILAACVGAAAAVHFEGLANEREAARASFESLATERENARTAEVTLREQEQDANRQLGIERQRLLDAHEATRLLLYQSHMNEAWQAWHRYLGPTQTRSLLARWQPGQGRDLRNWEWHYLNSLLHKQSLELVGHTGPVRAVAWSHDGNQLATGGADGTVRVWGSASGQPIGIVARHDGPVTTIAWHPDGHQIVSIGLEGTAKISDPTAGSTIWTIPTGQKKRLCAAWDHEGKRLATGGEAGTIHIWNLEGKVVTKFRGHVGEVLSVAWSSDGESLVAVGDDETVRVWNVSTGKVAHWFPNPRTWAPKTAWGNAQYLAFTTENSRISLRLSRTGQVHRELAAHEGEVLTLDFAGDGSRLASAGWDGVLRIWDTATGQELFGLRGHTGYVNAVSWSPDGTRVASASDDGTAKIWLADRPQPVTVFRGHANRVSSVSWAPDGKALASSSADRTIRIWNVEGGDPRVLKGHTMTVRQVGWGPDGKLLASTCMAGELRIWNASTGAGVHTFTDLDVDLVGVEWAPDGKQIVTAGSDGTAKIWDVPGRKLVRVLKGHTAGVNYATWRPDGKQIATASNDGTIKVWDTETGCERQSIAAHAGGAYSVAWGPQGKVLASGGYDKLIRLWDTQSWSETARMAAHTDVVYALAWSPDGSRLASSSCDGSLILWAPSNAREIVTFRTHTNQVVWATWSRDGRRLATASSDRIVHVFDAGVSFAPRP